ncbi:MAG: ELM1/GtrOC1 family putative glycosyltransferase, partial [Hyphomicrobiaceae bacterium]
MPLAILILSDGRPGHYHLAEGVAAAIGRRVAVEVQRLEITRRTGTPGRLLAGALRLGVPVGWVLRAGYGLDAGTLPRAGVVISAGGDTLAANVASARHLRAASIYCGTLRHVPPEAVSLVVSSYARHASLPRHLVALKPSGLDPDTLPSRLSSAPLGPGHPPRVAGLLVGGPSGLFSWRDDEWARLGGFLGESHARHGTRWIVSTSRRTPDAVGDLLQAIARGTGSPIAELIDFRTAGPGTLPRLFASVEAILATEDSSTMMSEAVCARLPVVGVAPHSHSFKDEEREYRALMTAEGWCRSVPLASLSPE